MAKPALSHATHTSPGSFLGEITEPPGGPMVKIWTTSGSILWVVYTPAGPIWGRGQDALDAALARLSAVDVNHEVPPALPDLD
jgi:hypothetical protein